MQRSNVRPLGFWRRLAIVTATVAVAIGFAGAAGAAAGTVLILDTSVTGGASSLEAQAAIAAGHSVEVVNAVQWAAKTQADFATYDALILGDPTCGFAGSGVTAPYIGAAEANRSVWGPVIDGNIVAIGTDPVFHQSQGGDQLVTSGVKFAADAAGKTGLYVDLSCYYHDTAPGTPVLVLDPFGSFTVTGVGCYNDIHIVATHPALTGLTDADLENWSCSVHEAFDSYPESGPNAFLPLVIAEDPPGGPPLPGSKSFPGGFNGVPYILARGEGLVLISDITLTPTFATNPVGTTHTVTATVKENGTPIVGTVVTFTVTSGPHAGVTGTAVTDASGVANFTYPGVAVGTDSIEATYVDSAGTTKHSNVVHKEWTPALVEICGDGIDNDGDGLVDEGCPPPPPAIKGRMTGGGSVFTASGVRVTHGFELDCDAANGGHLQVNWGKGNRFHLTGVSASACSDNPAISEAPPAAGFDTLTGSGTGRYNGAAGATATWTFSDAGEPGTSDYVSLTIVDANSNTVLTVTGTLKNGNHQAHAK